MDSKGLRLYNTFKFDPEKKFSSSSKKAPFQMTHLSNDYNNNRLHA